MALVQVLSGGCEGVVGAVREAEDANLLGEHLPSHDTGALHLEGAPKGLDDVGELGASGFEGACTPDPDGDPLTFSIAVPPANGSATLAVATGEVTYVANPGYVGPDSMTIEVTDGIDSAVVVIDFIVT